MPKPKTIDILSDVAPQGKVPEVVGRLIKQHNYEWELCSHDFWFFASKIRTLDEERKIYRQFPLNFDYLRKAIYEWDKHQKVIYLKPRRMMISYLATVRMMHRAMMCGTGLPGSFAVYYGGIASVDENQAIYQCDRIREAYRMLPEWMKERNRLVVDNQTLLIFEKGGKIQGFPMKREGPQGYGFSDFLFDEMAIQEAARSTWVGLVPTLGASGGLLAVSTPNGRANIFYDIWDNKDNRYPGIHRMECDWWDNPEHNKDWFARATAGLTRQEIARMYEKSFSVYAGTVIFPEFEERTHVREFDVLSDRPMNLGHDFGFLNPANLYFQVNTKDQFLIRKEFLDEERGYDDFLKDSIAWSNSWYKRSWGEVHFVDPAGRQRYASKARSGAINDIQEIKIQYGRYAKQNPPKPDPQVQVRFGAAEIGTRANEGPRLKEVRKLFKLRADGEPSIYVHPDCKMLIEGFKGAYVFPERKSDESGDNHQPIKNDASHIQDALQYGVTGYNQMFRAHSKPVEERKQKRINPRFGI